MAQINDNDPPSGGDWFDQQGPPPSSGSGSGATLDDVKAAYQSLLGRPAESDAVAQNWIAGTGGDLAKIKAGIAATDEGKAYAAQAAPAAASGGGRTDRNAILAQVAKWAAMPGADPSLGKDPNYWADRIIEKGGLGDDNRQYWQDASVGPTAFFNNPNRDQGAAAGSPSANFGAAPSPYVAPVYTPPSPYVAPTYTAPTWTGGPPPTAPTLSQYKPPTQAELEASPGYLARMKADQVAQERSAASRGSVLNGGFQVALARRQGELASGEYGNLVAQGQATTGLNNAATQTEFGDTFSNYLARYGQFTDAAALGKNAFDTNAGNQYAAYTTNAGIGKNAFDTNAGNQYQAYQTNVSNTRNNENDYWSRLNDLYQSGLQAANNSYKPGPTL